jgi:hypothetical protein
MVSLATLRADVWNTVYSAITASSATTSIATHTNSWPDLKDGDPSFPLLIIDNPRPARVNSNSSVNNSNVVRDTEIELTLYTKKAVQVDTITDALINQLESIKDSTFGAADMHWLEVEDGTHTMIQLESGNKLHEKVILLRFKCLV